MSSVLIALAAILGVVLLGVGLTCTVVFLDRHQRRSSDQASTINALQMSLFSIAQAAERHHDAVALNGARLEGTTTTPAHAQADARTAAVTYSALIRDRQLKSLSKQILDVSDRLLRTTHAADATRLNGEILVLSTRFRDRKVEVVRDLSRRRFARS